MLIDKLKKRISIFLVVPVLAALLYFIDDPVIKIVTIIFIVVYVGFIIFLRDMNHSKSDAPPVPKLDIQPPSYEPDHGESIKIVSHNKNIEIITADNYVPEQLVGKKHFFKPPDLKENFYKIATEAAPKTDGYDKQFSFILEKILFVLKDTYSAHTAIFLWYNKKKQKLTLEQYVSNCSSIAERKFDLEDDVLSNIVRKEEPELLTDISPVAESDVIRYYEVAQGIKSFIGVPLYYGNNLAGILALDSKVSDAFGIETVFVLARYVRIISVIVVLFDEKYKESMAEKKLTGLLALLSSDYFFRNENELYQSLENSLGSLISWDAFSFVYYNPEEQKFKTVKIVNNTSLKYVGENLEVDLNGTLVGKCILSGTPVRIDDTSASAFIRFSKFEDVSFDGSFLTIPLVYEGRNYGVLCFESLKKNAYTNGDVQFMQSAVRMMSFVVYSFSSQSMMRKLLSVDIETKTLNKGNFIDRLNSDLYKSNQLNIQGAVILVYIDDFLNQELLFESDPFPKVLKAVAEAIIEELTPSNLIGRIHEKIYGVYFFNASVKDVFLWAEKMRSKIARKPVSISSKQTTFTVSIGVAPTTGKSSAEEVLNDAELALRKALEKGGNAAKTLS
ncbi:MAG: GAF domain-containing protein [Ignavibacteria bacterium]